MPAAGRAGRRRGGPAGPAGRGGRTDRHLRRAANRRTRPSSSTPRAPPAAPKGAVLTQLNMTMNAMVSRHLGAVPDHRRRDPGLPAAVPLVRPDLRDERRLLRRLDAGAAAPVRRRRRAGADRRRERQRLHGRARPCTSGCWPRPATDERRPVLRIAVSGGASLPVAVIDNFARGVRGRHLRGLRAVRDLAGGDVQPAGLRPQTRHGRPGDLGHRRGDRRRRRSRTGSSCCRRARSARWCCAGTTSSPAT